MNKTQALQHFAKDSETKQFFASALDKIQQANTRNQMTSTGFFTPEEAADFPLLLAQLKIKDPYHFTGGYPSASRSICVFPPPWEQDFQEEQAPLSVIEATIKGEVGHRDVLGSLMSLGLTRRKFGDILLDSTQCQVLVLEETAPILLSQWSSVGRYPLSLKESPLTQLKVPEQSLKDIVSTVATLRLDSVLATGFSLSRSKASSFISSGAVTINHKECKKPDKQINQGDILVCRGYGKCLVTEIKGESKKGRIILHLQKYI